MRRVERWLFAPGSDRRLAAVRVGLCALLAVRLSRGLYVGLAGQPDALYRAPSFMKLFPSMPPRGVTLIVQALGVAAAAAGAVGLLTRFSVPLAWASGMFLNGMATSLGKVVHNDVPLLLAMVPLLVAPVADAWSIDAARRRTRVPERWSVRYGWPVRAGMVTVAGAYFFSGFNKLVFSGPAWVTTDNLRWVLYTASDQRGGPVATALFIADRPLLAHLLAAATLIVGAVLRHSAVEASGVMGVRPGSRRPTRRDLEHHAPGLLGMGGHGCDRVRPLARVARSGASGAESCATRSGAGTPLSWNREPSFVTTRRRPAGPAVRPGLRVLPVVDGQDPGVGPAGKDPAPDPSEPGGRSPARRNGPRTKDGVVAPGHHGRPGSLSGRRGPGVAAPAARGTAPGWRCGRGPGPHGADLSVRGPAPRPARKAPRRTGLRGRAGGSPHRRLDSTARPSWIAGLSRASRRRPWRGRSGCRSAPARRMPVRISRSARRSSIQPFAAAALTIAYSPLTL